MAKRSKWFEGLLYAENECNAGNGAAVVAQIDAAFLGDHLDDFDRGARDYLNHKFHTLKEEIYVQKQDTLKCH